MDNLDRIHNSQHFDAGIHAAIMQYFHHENWTLPFS